MGGINFACLAIWVLNPDWPSRKLQFCDFFRRLGEVAAPGEGECGPCPGICLTNEENHGKPQSG